MLERLKNLDLERLDVDEMVAMLAFAKSLAAEYQAQQAPAPEWVDTRAKELKREINTRLADMKEKRKKEIKAKLQSLKSAQERREELTKELEQLEASQ